MACMKMQAKTPLTGLVLQALIFVAWGGQHAHLIGSMSDRPETSTGVSSMAALMGELRYEYNNTIYLKVLYITTYSSGQGYQQVQYHTVLVGYKVDERTKKHHTTRPLVGQQDTKSSQHEATAAATNQNQPQTELRQQFTALHHTARTPIINLSSHCKYYTPEYILYYSVRRRSINTTCSIWRNIITQEPIISLGISIFSTNVGVFHQTLTVRRPSRASCRMCGSCSEDPARIHRSRCTRP